MQEEIHVMFSSIDGERVYKEEILQNMKKRTIVLRIRHNCFLQLMIKAYKEEKSCKCEKTNDYIIFTSYSI